MAKEENFSSIFEAAGKMGKKTTLPGESAQKDGKNEASTSSQEDMESRYIKCKTFHEIIKKSIDDAYENAKVSPRAVSQYLETPTNFPEKEWHRIQETKSQYAEKLKKLVPKNESSDEQPPEEPAKLTGANDKPKGGRPKSGLVSKKGWMSMH